MDLADIKRKNIARNGGTESRELWERHILEFTPKLIVRRYPWSSPRCTLELIHIKSKTEERRPEENSNKDAWELVRRAPRHTGAGLAA